MRIIKSAKNQLYRNLLKQGSSHAFKKSQLILIEGRRQIEEALQARAQLEYLIFSDDASGAEQYQEIIGAVPSKARHSLNYSFNALDEEQIVFLKADLYQKLAVSKSPQPVLAFLKPHDLPLNEIKSQDTLVLIDVQDPGNVGTLIRSADAFNIKQILLLGATASPWLAKTIRAAMGSIFHLNIFVEEEINTALQTLQEKKIKLWAMDVKGADIRKIAKDKNIALLLGNEGNGLDQEVREVSDQIVTIEMPGDAESLNVAMAGSIALYELSSK